MSDKIQLFEDQPIRTAWDEEKEEWYFSVVDVVGVLTEQKDYDGARNYWKVLKIRIKEEGNELVTNCNQLVVLQIIYGFMLHFIYNHFQDYPECHITLFKPDYAHKILLSKNEAHYLTRMRLLTARTFGFSVTYD